MTLTGEPMNFSPTGAYLTITHKQAIDSFFGGRVWWIES